METMKHVPIIVIEPGMMPRFESIDYVKGEDYENYEPSYPQLKAWLDCEMVEHVGLDHGISLWCDEEGRLSDDAKASCVVEAPLYAGDIAGTCVLAVDMTRGPFDAFAAISNEEIRNILVRRFLFGFGRTHIAPPPEGYVLAEPKIEILPMCSECMGPIRPDEGSIEKDGREIHTDCEKGGAA